MEPLKLDATSRNDFGKGPAKRLRNSGQVPAVAYGKGHKSVTVSVSPKTLLHALKSDHGQNTVIELDIDKGADKMLVLVRDYSYHPVSRALTHVDFMQIKVNEPVDVEVPFLTYGKCQGITAGGVLRVVYRSLPIRCLPDKIPVKIEHDITTLGLGEAVKASQVKLPEGVAIRLPEEQTIAAIIAPEKDRGDDAAAAAPGAAAPAAAAGAKDAKGAAAKPAAAPAKDAKKK